MIAMIAIGKCRVYITTENPPRFALPLFQRGNASMPMPQFAPLRFQS